MMKMLKLLRFNKKVMEFTSTLSISKESVISFTAMFSILFGAFVQFFFFVYGGNLKNYSTLVKAAETLFAMMLKRFTYGELVEHAPYLGPIFFVFYLVFVGFILMQVLVAVLSADYSTVKRKLRLTTNDYEIIDFMINQLKLALSGRMVEDNKGNC